MERGGAAGGGTGSTPRAAGSLEVEGGFPPSGVGNGHATAVAATTMHVVPAVRRRRTAGARGRSLLSKLDPFRSCRGQPASVKTRLTFSRLLPFTAWMVPYDFVKNIRGDLLAGITVGVMVIPQGIAYASLASLSPSFGLYAGLSPPFVYSGFGTSSELAVGPVAILSLQVSSGLQGTVRADDPDYPKYAFTIAFLSGLIQIGLGLFHLGFLISFLSHSVVSGFTSGAAILIGLGQVNKFFGYSTPKKSTAVEILIELFKGIDQFHWEPFVLGLGLLAIALGMKEAGKRLRIPIVRALGPLTVVAVGIALSWPLRLDKHNVAIVGFIEPGLPSFEPLLPVSEWGSVFGTVVAVVFIGLLESVAIAKSLAAKRGYTIDANQELLALGAANAIGGPFQAYPTTGSFSRSAVMYETGSRTPLAGLISACLVLLTAAFLTSWFYFLPECGLAAIVVSAVVGIFDYEEAAFLWRAKKLDFVLWLVAAAGTAFAGVEIGIAIAVGLSLVFVLYESARPRTAILGRLPGDMAVYRNVKQYPEARLVPGCLILRIDAPIYFANVDFIRDKLRKYERYHVGRHRIWRENGRDQHASFIHFSDIIGPAGGDGPERNAQLDPSDSDAEEECAILEPLAPRSLSSGGDAYAYLGVKDSETLPVSGPSLDAVVPAALEEVAVLGRGAAGTGLRQRRSPKKLASTDAPGGTSGVAVSAAGDAAVPAWIDGDDDHPDRLRFLVLDLAPVTSVDSSAIHALVEVFAEYHARSIRPVLANPNTSVLRTLGDSGLLDTIGREWVFVRTADAVQACVASMQAQDLPSRRPEASPRHDTRTEMP